MNRVNIYRPALRQDTLVSNAFIDEYMADANDAQLKIYLFLTRMLGANLSTCLADIADKFNYTEKDVLRALMYWESRNVLALDFDAADNLCGIQVLPLDTAYRPGSVSNTNNNTNNIRLNANNTSSCIYDSTLLHMQGRAQQPGIMPVLSFIRPSSAQNTGARATGGDIPVKSESKSPEKDITTPAKPGYTLDDLKSFRSNEDASQLLMVAEQYVGRQLSRSDMETVLFIYDRLGFCHDLIDYLIQYCVERGKKDFRYIEKVALAWHSDGITTPKEAQDSCRSYDKNVYSIMKYLGKNTTPAPKELEYINKWTKEYCFSLDVIKAACDKAVVSTDTRRFAYADGILGKWHSAGVRNVADIAKADAAFAADRRGYAGKSSNKPASSINSSNKFNRFAQNSYDFDKLEKNLISN